MAELWYYTKNGQPQDPVSASDLKRLAKSGQLSPTDLVWKEGMANWVKASTSKGLFEEGPASGVKSAATTAKPVSKPRPAEVDKDEWDADDDIAELEEVVEDDEPRPAKRKSGVDSVAEDEWDDERPRRRRKRYEDEDEDEDRPRRKRRKKSQEAGPPVAGMIIGGVLVLLLVVGAVLALVLTGGASMEGSYNWSLGTNDKFTRNLTLLAGHRVELRVNSTGKSDVDLFIYDGDREMMKDESLSSNCMLNFIPPATKSYRLVVWNRLLEPQPFRNGPNNGTLTYKQIKLGEGPAANVPVPGNPVLPNGGPGVDLNQAGRLNERETRSFNVALDSRFNYTIDLRSDDFDAFLKLFDSANRLIVADDDGGNNLDSRIVIRPQQSGNYRIEVSALDGEPGAFTLMVRHQ